jgi:hypothetical protein
MSTGTKVTKVSNYNAALHCGYFYAVMSNFSIWYESYNYIIQMSE